MHGVKRSLIEKQSESLNLPLFPVFLPNPPSTNPSFEFTSFPSNETYFKHMHLALKEIREKFGIEAVVFGDMYPEEVRASIL